MPWNCTPRKGSHIEGSSRTIPILNRSGEEPCPQKNSVARNRPMIVQGTEVAVAHKAVPRISFRLIIYLFLLTSRFKLRRDTLWRVGCNGCWVIFTIFYTHQQDSESFFLFCLDSEGPSCLGDRWRDIWLDYRPRLQLGRIQGRPNNSSSVIGL